MTVVPNADQETASDLKQRYQSVASHAASLWQDAEVIRLGLVAQGMTLNADTAAGLDLLIAMLDEASADLAAHNWTEAAGTLDRAENQIRKVGKTIGR